MKNITRLINTCRDIHPLSPVACLVSLVSLCLSVTVVVLNANAQSGGQFTITKSVIAGGGGASSAGTFTLAGTIGQPLAGGPSSGANFSLISGFWGGGGSVAPTTDAPFDFD